MKEITYEFVLKILKKIAFNSVEHASIFGMAQPKEPKSLSNKTKEV